MATIEERLAALEALLGLSEGEAPYVSKYSGPEIDEGIELARSGTVRNTGGTMKGSLNFRPDGVTGYTQVYKNAASDAADYGTLLNDKDSAGNLIGLKLRAATGQARIVDGANEYDIYHAGNKPTSAAIGAVAKDGSVAMTGNLTVKKTAPYLTLSHSETGRQFRLAETGDNYASLYNEVTENAGNNKTALWLAPEGTAMAKLLRINVVENGASSTYSVLHTGNMDSLISSLRIATGTYTGTGNYGGTVTLTCGFKPAFAIVYQADANDLAVSEEDGGWSSTFAVLVPTATGRKINIGQTGVSVESGDTYLKITSTAHELNQNIAYNYIIVGS